MGLLVWLDLKGIDVAAFLVADILGYFVGTWAEPGPWPVFISILVSYHLFLMWLVFNSERRATVALPVGSTLVTHLACLTLILPIGFARHFIPFFGIFRFLIAAFAVFERGWLFSGNAVEPGPERVPETHAVVQSTAEDFEAWHRYLAQQNPGSRPVGVSIKTEYEQWLRARHGTPPS